MVTLIPPDHCPHPADRVGLGQEWDGSVLVASFYRCRDCGAALGPADG